ncbi:MAG: hypothetical protein JWO12_2584 [Frankiales bacterium]|nr:hypothetical protein [Frankiales bacterium]
MTATAQLSTPQLLQQLSDQTKTLVSQEIALAKLELGAKAKKGGAGAGALIAALVLVHFAAMVLLAAAVLGLATVVSGWLAALIVGGALLLLAVVLALVGKRFLSKMGSPAPAATIASAKADVAAVKTAAAR